MWPRPRALLLIAIALAGAICGCVNLDRPRVGLLDGPPATTDMDTDVVASTDGRPGDAPDDPDAPVDPDADPDADPPLPDADIDLPPDLPPDVAPLASGRPCATGDQCVSGQCVDGVCCEAACAGACRTCNATGNEGRCTLVATGEDPGNDCPQDPLAMCMRDGTCDGAGTCRLYTAGTECGAGRCQGTTEFAASTCDGAGTCRAGASRTCPGGGTCMGSSCGSSCTVDASCQNGFFCDQGICRAKRARGAACTGPAQCASGFCADSVCCSTACTETCHACNVAVAPGTCTPVPAGQDPRNICPTDPAASCARNGACNGAGACQFYAAGSSCGSSTCSNSTETLASTCNGIGVCMASGTRDCGAYTCGATACFTSCSSGTQCNPGYSCTGTSCQPLGGLVLYWKLDDTGGPTAFDSSGGGRHGTFTGVGSIPTTSTLAPPVLFPDPASRRFNKSNREAVRLTPMPSAIKPTTALTVSLWYRTNVTDVGEGTPSSEMLSAGDSYILRVRSDGVEFSIRATTPGRQKCQMNVTSQLNNGWHHVAGVLTPTGLRGYFDGVESCFLPGNLAIAYDLGTEFVVGRHGDGDLVYNYEGNIDEVRVYNRSLSAAELLRLAQGRSQL